MYINLQNMTKIITLANQKGGVGKSTVAMNLGLCFQYQLRVAIVDADLQGSIYHIRDDFPNLDILSLSNTVDLKSLDYDLIIIDTPPYLSTQLNDLFAQSDFVLIPTKAGFFDVRAIRSTLMLVKFAQAKNDRLKAGILLNMLKPRSGITAAVSSLLDTLGTTVLKTRIYDRVSLAKSSMTDGVIKGTDKKAIEEILSLAEEILEILDA